MLLTRECDYGIRIIRALSDGEKKTADEICEKENIPSQFAYKILKKLERAGFLLSSRGREGGYWLIMPLDSFSIYDIVTTIDGNLAINACLKEGSDCPFRDGGKPCAVHVELDRIQSVLMNELKGKSILEVVSESA